MYESPITVLVGPKKGLEARKRMMEQLHDMRELDDNIPLAKHIKEAIDKARADEEKIITDYIELFCEEALCLVIDKGELKKALLYDRQQYEKGYADGKATVIHCKDCKHWNPEENSIHGICKLRGVHYTGSWFCGDASRKEDENADTEAVPGGGPQGLYVRQRYNL